MTVARLVSERVAAQRRLFQSPTLSIDRLSLTSRGCKSSLKVMFCHAAILRQMGDAVPRAQIVFDHARGFGDTLRCHDVFDPT